jgi:hypothetical protein
MCQMFRSLNRLDKLTFRLTADHAFLPRIDRRIPFAARVVCEECASADNRGVSPSVTTSVFPIIDLAKLPTTSG